MTLITKIFLVISFLLFIAPPILWGIYNIKKSGGETSWKFRQKVKWSWFICMPLSCLFVVIALVVLV